MSRAAGPPVCQDSTRACRRLPLSDGKRQDECVFQPILKRIGFFIVYEVAEGVWLMHQHHEKLRIPDGLSACLRRMRNLGTRDMKPSTRFKRAFGLIELIVLVSIMGWVTSFSAFHAYTTSQWADYRMTMQEVTGLLRTMPSHAWAQQHPVSLHIDQTHHAFRIAVKHPAPQEYEVVERTIWLPEGLRISEAPAAITALPAGSLSIGDIVIIAPAYSRLFRVTTTARGVVQLDEESIL